MRRRKTHILVGLLITICIGSFAVPASAAKRAFTLDQAVPNDVFLFAAGRHNPERAFLDKYWDDIWDALDESGIGADVMALIGSFMNEEQMGEMDRLKALASRLLGGVDWEKLSGGEMAFAERMSGPQSMPRGGVHMGAPDIVMLFRADGAEANFDGLVALLDGAIDEIEKIAGDKDLLHPDRTPRKGDPMFRINLLERVPNAPPLSISVARHGNVVAIAMGDGLVGDVLDLLGGRGKKKAIGDDPRFKAAFVQLPAAEDGMTFFDMQAMLKPFRGLPDLIAAEMGGPHDVTRNARENAEANALNGQAVAAYRDGDMQEALTLIRKAHEVAPDDSVVLYNLACFSTLSGDKDAGLRWLKKAVEAGFFAPHKIASDSDLKALHGDARFDKTLADARTRAAAAGAADHADKAKLGRYIANQILDAVGILDYTAEVESTEGYSVHKHALVALVPGAERKPIYSVFAKSTPAGDFDRYLPAETESFSVSGGVDIGAFYGFLLDTVRGAGPVGEDLLAKWEGLQAQFGVDVRKDVLGWIDGRCISVTLADGAGSVWMVKVTDAEAAHRNVDRAMEALSTGLAEAVAKQPMLGMLAVRRAPASDARIPGFEHVFIGMSPQPLVWGVADGHLVVATSADAAVTCLDTAKGKHPGIRTNARVMREAVVPDGPFTSVGLADQRSLGQQFAMGLGVFSMFGGMASMSIPQPEIQKAVSKVVGMIGKLSPVVAKIDFYKSTATRTTFDGRVWRVAKVTHYVSPDEHAEKRVAAGDASGTR